MVYWKYLDLGASYEESKADLTPSQKSFVTKILLTGVEGLDPISAFLDCQGKQQGKLTVECYGTAWSCYWGAMGCDRVEEFIDSANVDYITEKLSNAQRNVIDYTKIEKECNLDDEVNETTLLFFQKEVMDFYGDD